MLASRIPVAMTSGPATFNIVPVLIFADHLPILTVTMKRNFIVTSLITLICR